jgi:hypothetical protein
VASRPPPRGCGRDRALRTRRGHAQVVHVAVPSCPQVARCYYPAQSQNRCRLTSYPTKSRLKTRPQHAACGRCSKLRARKLSRLLNPTQIKSIQASTAPAARTVPFDDFLPIPSLSTTSSAHWMCRRSEGSARSRSTPDGAERRTTSSVSSMVRLPVSREGVAVREGAGGVAVLCGVAIAQCQSRPGACWVRYVGLWRGAVDGEHERGVGCRYRWVSRSSAQAVIGPRRRSSDGSGVAICGIRWDGGV